MIRTVNYPFAIHNIKLSNDCNIAYIDEGQGAKTLLFIHGLATYSLSWKKNIDYLSKYYRCIAIDLPGNGLSDRGDYPYSINFFAGSVYDFIVQMGLKDVCIVGHSMGGQIGVTMLLNQPDCAKELILCAPAGFETFTPFETTIYRSSVHFLDMFSTDENSLSKTIKSSFYNYPSQANEMINELIDLMKAYPAKTYRNMIDGCINGMLHEPVFNSLHLIKQHTLVMYGERDALIPNKLIHLKTTRQIAEAAVKQMPDATLKMIPQCGHFLQWEKADEVNRLIREFLN